MGAYPTIGATKPRYLMPTWSRLVFGNELKSGKAWSIFSGRLAVAFLFLWSGIGKVQTLLAGKSATSGFLSGASVAGSPFAAFFNSLAGNPVAEYLVVAGEFAIGMSLVFGVFTRIGSVSGGLMMLLFTVAMWPIADTAGANPLVDYRVIYGVMFAMFFFLRPGLFLGVDGIVQRLGFVERRPRLHRVLHALG